MKNSLLSDITTRLSSISDTPALEASVLIGHVAGKSRTWVLAHPELALTVKQSEQLESSLARLEHGEPFPYVLGHWEFFGIDFEVTPDVLIPRPETELLVEKAIGWLNENPERKSIADIGTGSGTIAISLATNMPDTEILATDVSPEVLQVAKRNAKKHNVSRNINFVECDLLPIHQGDCRKIDLMCANLPYIPSKSLRQLSVYESEPTLALDGGEDGLELYRKLLGMVPKWLTPNGLILMEIDSTCGTSALDLAQSTLPDATVHLHQDLAGLDRLLEIRL